MQTSKSVAVAGSVRQRRLRRAASTAGGVEEAGTDYAFPGHDSFGLLLRVAMLGLRRSFKEQLAEYGIPLNIWYYLRVLWENDGLSQKELTRRVGILQPNGVGTIQAMEKLGLVRVERSSPDLRRLCIRLSPKARDLKRVLLPKVRERVETVAFKDFDDQDRRRLVALLGKVCVNVTAAKTSRDSD
jgi:MarR family transcriptional regulator, organic hydroperoxide resistance regulator